MFLSPWNEVPYEPLLPFSTGPRTLCMARLEPTMVAAAVGASAVAGVASSAIQSSAQGDAADAQIAAAQQAGAAANEKYYQARDDLLPFIGQGRDAANMLAAFNYVDPAILSELQKPFTPGDLEKTPGYQFTLNQGIKNIGNSASARGGAVGGNVLRGLQDYTTGLAQTTYGNEFNRYLTQNQQIFNMLTSSNQNQFNQLLARATLGANAGAQVGSFGSAAGQQIGNAAIGAGNAAAASTIGQANALAGGLQNAGNAFLSYNMFDRMFPSGGGAGAGITYGMAP